MNKQKVDIEKYKYKDMYKRFMMDDNPAVCVSGTFDISNLVKIKKKGHSLNALICYCLMQAGQNIDEFHYMIKEDGLYYYDDIKSVECCMGILNYIFPKHHVIVSKKICDIGVERSRS